MSLTLDTESVDFGALRHGQHVLVRLHRDHGLEANTMHTVFLDTGQEAGYLRAHFRDPGEAFIWNARLVHGKWIYGVNENEFITVDKILPKVGEEHVPQQPEGEKYLYDKHLNRLRARRTR
jgi:hypothetical protein